MNSDRGNRQFAAGSGNATNISGDWYPGDEFKGDAARIIMYMYVRYGTQCYPSYAAEGTLNSIDPNMIDILLQWNAEDPVSRNRR
ncbi:endonuclease [Lacinutrix neustonica]|uniref:Endonuclease n=1 Tax=Lacinutrix neustonica TaxID=2980107 RepID=A0A9E8MZ60_9FLAO|nr:endonuclease [Lacinutrix neustonica]WAC03192.1 endonuclease [Lacinutrix neustonica]